MKTSHYNNSNNELSSKVIYVNWSLSFKFSSTYLATACFFESLHYFTVVRLPIFDQAI
jgi:hypothetical protein